MQITRFQGMSYTAAPVNNVHIAAKNQLQSAGSNTGDVYFGRRWPAALVLSAATLAVVAPLALTGSDSTTANQPAGICTSITANPEKIGEYTAAFSNGSSISVNLQTRALTDAPSSSYNFMERGRLSSDPGVQERMKDMLEDFAQKGLLNSNEPVNFVVSYLDGKDGRISAEQGYSTGILDFRATEGYALRQDHLVALKKYAPDLDSAVSVTGFVGHPKNQEQAIKVAHDAQSYGYLSIAPGIAPRTVGALTIDGKLFIYEAEIEGVSASDKALLDQNVRQGIHTLLNGLVGQFNQEVNEHQQTLDAYGQKAPKARAGSLVWVSQVSDTEGKPMNATQITPGHWETIDILGKSQLNNTHPPSGYMYVHGVNGELYKITILPFVNGG